MQKNKLKVPAHKSRKVKAGTVPQELQPEQPLDPAKRRFLAGAAVTAGVVGLPALSAVTAGEAHANGDDSHGVSSLKDVRRRRNASAGIRIKAAIDERRRRLLQHPTNGDEERFSDSFIGNFSKTLPHQDNGEVDPDAYRALLHALETTRLEDFEAIPAGGFFPLINPIGGFAFTLEGPDTAAVEVEPPPSLASPEFAAQLAELYWMACMRDVPFADFDSNALALEAQSDLSVMSGYEGPTSGGFVGPQDLFRTDYPGVRTGPMISQFLYQDFNYDGITIVPRIDAPALADFVTDFPTWLAVQRGQVAGGIPLIPDTTVFPRTVRDLGKIAGSDTINSVYFRAAKVIGFFAETDPANPYPPFGQGRQFGFATFGLAHLVELLGKAHKSERHAWFSKWCVHRFLRPEAAGGRVERIKNAGADYPIHPDLIENSTALDCVFDRFGGYLLPLMFEGGGPTHPSFTAGHAISAGACVTILKAWFNEAAPLPFDAFDVSPDGQERVPYVGPALTVGGELNKLCHNLSFGRDMSGVHWRADDIEGNRQGEEVAIRILREEKAIYPEPFEGFTLTKFDGETITI